jgi:hypothetical protein
MSSIFLPPQKTPAHKRLRRDAPCLQAGARFYLVPDIRRISNPTRQAPSPRQGKRMCWAGMQAKR